MQFLKSCRKRGQAISNLKFPKNLMNLDKQNISKSNKCHFHQNESILCQKYYPVDYANLHVNWFLKQKNIDFAYFACSKASPILFVTLILDSDH